MNVVINLAPTGYLAARCETVGVDPRDVQAHNAGLLPEERRAMIEAIMREAAARLRMTPIEGRA